MANGTPLILGHRGALDQAPENTMPAFERAQELAAGGFELDVRLTKDGVPVVMHDEELLRTTGASGTVGGTTLEELRALDAGSWFDPKFQDCRVPTLEEVLEHFASHHLRIVMEIKEQPGRQREAAQVIGAIITRHRFRHTPIISSSSTDLVREFYRAHPHIERALIIKTKLFSFLRTVLFANLYRIGGVHVRETALTSTLVGFCRRLGLHILMWPATTPEAVAQAVAFGVEGIIADDITMAQRARKGEG